VRSLSTPKRAAMGLLLLAAAVFCAALTRGVESASNRAHSEATSWQVALQHRKPDSPGPIERLGANLLGVGSRVAILDAYSRYRRSTEYDQYTDRYLQDVIRADSEVELVSLRDRLTGPARAEIDVLLGVMYRVDVTSGSLNADRAQARALESFRDALRADPLNEDAKYDLELLLTQQTQPQPPPKKNQPEPKRKGNPKAATERQGSGF
jgi:hypothetical protein